MRDPEHRGPDDQGDLEHMTTLLTCAFCSREIPEGEGEWSRPFDDESGDAGGIPAGLARRSRADNGGLSFHSHCLDTIFDVARGEAPTKYRGRTATFGVDRQGIGIPSCINRLEPSSSRVLRTLNRRMRVSGMLTSFLRRESCCRDASCGRVGRKGASVPLARPCQPIPNHVPGGLTLGRYGLVMLPQVAASRLASQGRQSAMEDQDWHSLRPRPRAMRRWRPQRFRF